MPSLRPTTAIHVPSQQHSYAYPSSQPVTSRQITQQHHSLPGSAVSSRPGSSYIHPEDSEIDEADTDLTEQSQYEHEHVDETSPETYSSEKDNESVRVAVRCRPLLPSEYDNSNPNNRALRQTCIRVDPEEQTVTLGHQRLFTFDFAFDDSATQQQLYEQCVRPLVLGCFEGYNATVFAYGQTGSGKTYTMGSGTYAGIAERELGIIPRVVREIFSQVAARERDIQCTFQLRVSYLEIYQEELKDLLHPTTPTKAISIREDVNGGVVLMGVREETVGNYDEMMRCLARGSISRTTGSTLMNAHSSRSHSIFTITMEQILASGVDLKRHTKKQEHIKAKFHLVDLAGSERAKKTGAQGIRFKESVNINRGLLALGNVISALSQPAALAKQRNTHVPYRESKLTRLLQGSLGGNSRTLMIACLSPADANFEETHTTLKYAHRAKNIKNKPIVNRAIEAAPVEPPQHVALIPDTPEQQLHDAMHAEIAQLKQQLMQQGGRPSDITAELQSVIDALTADKEDKERDTTRLTERLTTLLMERSWLVQGLQRMCTRLQQFYAAEAARDQLKEQVIALRHQYESLIAQHNTEMDPDSSMSPPTQQQEQRIMELAAEIKIAQKQYVDTRTQLQQLRADLQSCVQEYATIALSVDELDPSSLTPAHAELEEQLSKARRELEDTRRELDAAKEDLKYDDEIFEEKITQLKEAHRVNEQKEAELKSLKSQLSIMHQVVKEMSAQVQTKLQLPLSQPHTARDHQTTSTTATHFTTAGSIQEAKSPLPPSTPQRAHSHPASPSKFSTSHKQQKQQLLASPALQNGLLTSPFPTRHIPADLHETVSGTGTGDAFRSATHWLVSKVEDDDDVLLEELTHTQSPLQLQQNGHTPHKLSATKGNSWLHGNQAPVTASMMSHTAHTSALVANVQTALARLEQERAMCMTEKLRLEQEKVTMEQAMQEQARLFQNNQKKLERSLRDLRINVGMKQELIRDLSQDQLGFSLDEQYTDRIRGMEHEIDRKQKQYHTLRDEMHQLHGHARQEKDARLSKLEMELLTLKAAYEQTATQQQVKESSSSKLTELEKELNRMRTQETEVKNRLQEEHEQHVRSAEDRARELKILKRELDTQVQKLQEIEADIQQQRTVLQQQERHLSTAKQVALANSPLSPAGNRPRTAPVFKRKTAWVEHQIEQFMAARETQQQLEAQLQARDAILREKQEYAQQKEDLMKKSLRGFEQVTRHLHTLDHQLNTLNRTISEKEQLLMRKSQSLPAGAFANGSSSRPITAIALNNGAVDAELLQLQQQISELQNAKRKATVQRRNLQQKVDTQSFLQEDEQHQLKELEDRLDVLDAEIEYKTERINEMSIVKDAANTDKQQFVQRVVAVCEPSEQGEVSEITARYVEAVMQVKQQEKQYSTQLRDLQRQLAEKEANMQAMERTLQEATVDNERRMVEMEQQVEVKALALAQSVHASMNGLPHASPKAAHKAGQHNGVPHKQHSRQSSQQLSTLLSAQQADPTAAVPVKLSLRELSEKFRVVSKQEILRKSLAAVQAISMEPQHSEQQHSNSRHVSFSTPASPSRTKHAYAAHTSAQSERSLLAVPHSHAASLTPAHPATRTLAAPPSFMQAASPFPATPAAFLSHHQPLSPGSRGATPAFVSPVAAVSPALPSTSRSRHGAVAYTEQSLTDNPSFIHPDEDVISFHG